jgi:hypothetical protein
MKKYLFFLTLLLSLLCSTDAKSQNKPRKPLLTFNDFIALSQNAAKDAAGLLYNEVKDFDKECFLTGTMDLDTINSANSECFCDTMAYQRVITYRYKMHNMDIDIALIVVSLFKSDHPDLRALRVCTRCCPPQRYYSSEVLSHFDPKDPICEGDPDTAIKMSAFQIELYSSSLAKITAGYYHNSVINKEKIATRAQKLSFLAGVFMRYGCYEINNGNGPRRCRISIRNSPSTAAVCFEILKELDCEPVDYVDILSETTQIFCMLSADVLKIQRLTDNMNKEILDNTGIAF